jgi:hypothetical protein
MGARGGSQGPGLFAAGQTPGLPEDEHHTPPALQFVGESVVLAGEVDELEFRRPLGNRGRGHRCRRRTAAGSDSEQGDPGRGPQCVTQGTPRECQPTSIHHQLQRLLSEIHRASSPSLRRV